MCGGGLRKMGTRRTRSCGRMRVCEVRLVSVCCQWQGDGHVDMDVDVDAGASGWMGCWVVRWLGGWLAHISVNQFVQTAMSGG